MQLTKFPKVSSHESVVVVSLLQLTKHNSLDVVCSDSVYLVFETSKHPI